MPPLYELQDKRAVCTYDIMDYVKAGEVIEDEFGRKIRVNRIIVKYILLGVRILNVFKFK